MKTLKFRHNLVKSILSGEKTTTWRLFDDKDLKIDDEIELIDWESKEIFAQGKIINTKEKRLNEIEEIDFEGHKKYESQEEMINGFKEFYGDKVNENTIVKIIKFEIL